ncbi:MAG: hypothetical protein GWO04_28320, partial [Actinobacteria bacterium]|nr:hypothetical protein [Actinomycetota bacterium]
GYATARVNGASHSDALKAAQTGAVLSGATAAMNVFMQSMASAEIDDRGLGDQVGPEPQAYHGSDVPNMTGTENGTSLIGENGWLGNAARDVPYGNYMGMAHDGFVTSLGDPSGLLGLAVNQGTHGVFAAMTIGSALAQSGAISVVVGDAAMAQAHRGDARSGSIWGFIAGGAPDLARGYIYGPISNM